MKKAPTGRGVGAAFAEAEAVWAAVPLSGGVGVMRVSPRAEGPEGVCGRAAPLRMGASRRLRGRGTARKKGGQMLPASTPTASKQNQTSCWSDKGLKTEKQKPPVPRCRSGTPRRGVEFFVTVRGGAGGHRGASVCGST